MIEECLDTFYDLVQKALARRDSPCPNSQLPPNSRHLQLDRLLTVASQWAACGRSLKTEKDFTIVDFT